MSLFPTILIYVDTPMDSKQIFAIILTILGLGGLIFTGVQIADADSDKFKTLIVTGILGLVFFSAGIKLLRSVGNAK